MYKVKQIPFKNIFVVEVKEEIDHKEIIEYLQIIVDNKINNDMLYLIVDYDDVIIKEDSPRPIKKIVSFINDVLKVQYKYIKWAITSNTRMPIAGAIYMKSLVESSNVKLEVFSTREATYSWMGLKDEEFAELREVLNKKH